MHGGALGALAVKLGLVKSGQKGVIINALLFAAITWIPLVVLSAIQGQALGTSVRIPFLNDIAENIKFLVVAPMLIASSVLVYPWLKKVVDNLRMFVRPHEQEKFDEIVRRAYVSTTSTAAELILLGVAYLRIFLLPVTPLLADITSWRAVGSPEHASYAMLYWEFFAQPLLLFLWLRWLWRYITWCILLFRTARLDLDTIPIHPDRVGGLGFIVVGHSKFAIIALAFSTQLSAVLGNAICYTSANLLEYRYQILSEIAMAVIIFVCPLMTFNYMLWQCKFRGLFMYGKLSNDYTRSFHDKWIKHEDEQKEPLLGSTDIQSLADMASSFDIVSTMKPTLINKDLVLTFALATALPFAPLLLSIYSLDKIVDKLWNMVIKF